MFHLPRPALPSAILFAWILASSAWLTGCTATPNGTETDVPVSVRLVQLGHSEVLILGEQHDAASHHRIHLHAVEALAQAGELAALVLEMADAGQSTRQLPVQATDAAIQQALGWRESAWPWAAYGPAIRAAVAAGVPVLGGNLPNRDNAATMREPAWDLRIPSTALTGQRQAVRDGHCNLLPAGQIGPMARIQIARDATLAATIAPLVRSGKTVLVLTGSAHAHRQLGIPLHLPTGLRLKTVRLAADGARPDDAAGFDAVWPTAAAPAKDHCAELQRQLRLKP
jgi:uncharacterized iron-regulated protein